MIYQDFYQVLLSPSVNINFSSTCQQTKKLSCASKRKKSVFVHKYKKKKGFIQNFEKKITLKIFVDK